MAFSVNKVILVGRLGKDPETRFMPNGNAVTNFSIATSEQWKDRETGDKQEATEWHNVVAYGKIAEIISEHANKGMSMYIEGQLKTRKWQDKSGADRYSTDIVIRDFIIHNEGPARNNPAAAYGESTVRRKDNARKLSATSRPSAEQFSGHDNEFDSEIPF